MTVRFYSSVAAETTLTNTITSGATSIMIGSAVGLPVLFPFTLALDYESASEELVEVTNLVGNTATVTRGIDGTSATGHNAGARVRHVASARDYADSRAHENADDGIHGLAPGEELVGTQKVQTLSNKTLDMATGTLSRINIFNDDTGGAWTTGVFGDSGTPNQNLMQWKPTSVATEVATVNFNGQYAQRNKGAAEDASITNNIFSAANSAGTIYYRVQSGGQIRSDLAAGATGITIVPDDDGVNQTVFRSRDAGDTTSRIVMNSNGSMTITGNDTAGNQLSVVGASGQSNSTAVLRVRNSTPTTVVSVFPNGLVDATSLEADITSIPAATLKDTVGSTSDRFIDCLNTSSASVASIRDTGAAFFTSITNQTSNISYRPTQVGVQSVSFTNELSFVQPVVFPVAFPSAPVVICNINSGAGETGQWEARAFNITTTGFDMFLNRSDTDRPAATWVGVPVGWTATA